MYYFLCKSWYARNVDLKKALENKDILMKLVFRWLWKFARIMPALAKNFFLTYTYITIL